MGNHGTVSKHTTYPSSLPPSSYHLYHLPLLPSLPPSTSDHLYHLYPSSLPHQAIIPIFAQTLNTHMQTASVCSFTSESHLTNTWSCTKLAVNVSSWHPLTYRNHNRQEQALPQDDVMQLLAHTFSIGITT